MIVIIFFSALIWGKTYTVGVEEMPFLPYSEVKDKEFRGLFRDVLDDFAKKEGISFIYKPMPIKRLYTEFFIGKIDFKVPSNSYWKIEEKKRRKVKIFYSDPLFPYIDGLMGFPNTSEVKTMGIVSGFTPWEYLEDIKKGSITIKENPSLKGLLQQVLLKRVDAVYINISVGQHYLGEMKKDHNITFLKDQPHIKSNYHISSIKHEEIIKKFNNYLKNDPDIVKMFVKKLNIMIGKNK